SAAHFERGVALAEQREWAPAIDELTLALEGRDLAADQRALILLQRAEVYEALGQKQSARDDDQAVFALDGASPPLHALAHVALGRLALQDGDAATAVAEMSLGLDSGLLPPAAQGVAFYNRGVAHGQLGRADAAIADYDASVKTGALTTY